MNFIWQRWAMILRTRTSTFAQTTASQKEPELTVEQSAAAATAPVAVRVALTARHLPPAWQPDQAASHTGTTSTPAKR